MNLEMFWTLNWLKYLSACEISFVYVLSNFVHAYILKTYTCNMKDEV